MENFFISQRAPLWLHCWWYLRQQQLFLDLTETEQEHAFEQYKAMVEQERVIAESINEISDHFDEWQKGMTWPTL
jgi:hypothetical protein